MAKENKVILYGYPEGKIKIHRNLNSTEIDYIRMDLITKRMTYANNLILSGPIREDSITVWIRNKEIIDKILNYKLQYDDDDYTLKHTMYMIYGTLSTKYISRSLHCPHCGKIYVKDHFLTYVDPINVHICEIFDDDPDEYLNQKIEISNMLFMWGTLCRPPDIYPPLSVIEETEEKLSKIECEFQIASNRKRKILEDEPDDTTDYPWVKTFGNQAIECQKTLDVGSEIYIHGSLQSRKVDNVHLCPYCNYERITEDKVMEIIPYKIMQDDMENTVFLYGKIQKFKISLDKNGKITMIKFYLMTIRKYFDFRLNVFKKNRYDIPLVTITNHDLIEQFLDYIDDNDINNNNIKNTMIFIKGSLNTADKKEGVVCPYCNYKYYKWQTNCYVDTAFFHIWDQNINDSQALKLLDEKYEISNILFLHGILCDDPSLYPNTSLFVHPSNRLCEFQLNSKRTRVYDEDEEEKNLYPWVRIHGNKALETKEALQRDSEIFIFGSIEAKKTLAYNTCPKCGKIFEHNEIISEIVPYSIEYGENCIKPDGIHSTTGDDEELFDFENEEGELS